MIDKIRYILLPILLAIMMIGGGIFFTIKGEQQSHKYKYYILVPNARDYRTNSYTSNEGCITFKNECNNTVVLCGNYSIVENK